MDMKLNSLPSKTWNRLNINESYLTLNEELDGFIPQVIKGEKYFKGNIDSALPALKNGMGSDMDRLVSDAPICRITVKSGENTAEPVVLKYSYKDGENKKSVLELCAEENSTLSVVMILDSEKDAKSGISAVSTRIYAEKNAKVNFYAVQMLNSSFICLNDIGGSCDEKAVINVVKLELGGKKTYAGANITLKGDESEFNTDIGYHAVKDQLIDMNYVSDHMGKNTNCLMEITGTLDDGSHKAFRGTIDFKRGCAGSKGTENENVLLLGDDLINQTIPLILCKEEDVEGNHGASIGRLDEDVLFYLGTRGFNEKTAQHIIAKSRIDAVCNKIPYEEIFADVNDFEAERSNYHESWD